MKTYEKGSYTEYTKHSGSEHAGSPVGRQGLGALV